jgi:DNA-directed RNA polymerase specialized sigma subunit
VKIAQRLGISYTRVAQIHAQSIKILRRHYPHRPQVQTVRYTAAR